MSAIAVLKQAWAFRVDYISKDGQELSMDSVLFARRMDTVYAYLARKFNRIAQFTKKIDVVDKGFEAVGERLELILNPDMSIVAQKADGTLVFHEPAPEHTYMPSTGTGYTYVPPPPKIVYPALDTYPVFDLVQIPAALHAMVEEHRFKAKFYDVFPKEK